MSRSEDPLRHPAGLFAGFLAATAFFTRLPVEPRAAGEWRLADSAWAFPLVGAGIGGAAALALLLAQLVGLASWLAALLSVMAGIALTGALHEDGLADTADGFCGGRDRDEKLAILRDSRQGTYGVLAIVLSVLLRAAALAGIGDVIHAGLALVAAHAVSRAALPAAMMGLTPARPDGLGATAGTPRAGGAIAAALIGTAIASAALGPGRGAIAVSLTGVLVFAMGELARRQIGGYTGDVLGAFQQVAEVVILLAASAR
ncbi:MAG TPA: adenosylcobinamide-GDP ribazoletransferase [Stellaceae bacterium]|nr:adenosylcobinamide-GDP ribazoletransferase [Stellaceae bacterium]